MIRGLRCAFEKRPPRLLSKFAQKMLSVCVLLVFMVIACVTDVARHRIYNWTTYPGIVTGIALRGWFEGWNGVQESLLGFLACGFVVLLCFVLFQFGGGDVKLIAMMGAFLGLHAGLEAMLWTFVLGSVLAVCLLIWQIGVARIVLKCMHHLVLVVRARSWIPLSPVERGPLQRGLFLAPAGLGAVVIVTQNEWIRYF